MWAQPPFDRSKDGVGKSPNQNSEVNNAPAAKQQISLPGRRTWREGPGVEKGQPGDGYKDPASSKRNAWRPSTQSKGHKDQGDADEEDAEDTDLPTLDHGF